MTIDALHDCGCRAAVIGTDKVKCGTPSFGESRVCFSPTLTMMPTQSDICWYNNRSRAAGHVSGDSGSVAYESSLTKKLTGRVYVAGNRGEVWSVLGEKTCLPAVGESGEHISSDHNFVNMFTQQNCLCWTDKGLSSNVMEGIRSPGASWQIGIGGPLRVAFFRNAKGDVKFT